MGPLQAFKTCQFQKYCAFKGRASRSEFWWYSLMAFLLSIATILLVAAVLSSGAAPQTFLNVLEGDSVPLFWGLLLSQLFIVGIPLWAATARRLHDRNLSGWWALISLMPLLGLAILVVSMLPGTVGPNRFGPDPLERSAPSEAAV